MSQFQNLDLFDENDDKDTRYGCNTTSKSQQGNDRNANPPADKREISIQIRDHDLTGNKFISYIIEIHIKSATHFWLERTQQKTNWSVLRRFSEFDSLRASLTKLYPACLIPPLPSKLSKLLAINSLNPWTAAQQKCDSDFIDSRRQRLEMFLNRILSHPKLQMEMLIFEFLQNDCWNDLGTKKDLSDKVGSIVNWRWINVQSRLINTFDNNFNISYFNELIKTNTLSDEARKIIDKGKSLQDNIRKLLNSFSKVDEQNSLLHHLYKNYGEAFFDWCSVDLSMGDTLQSFGHMCDTFSTLIDSPAPNDRPIILQQSGTSGSGVFNILSFTEICLLLQELYDYGESWIELGGRMAFIHRQLIKLTLQTETKSDQLERLKNGQPLKSGGFSSITNKFRKSLSESEVSDLRSNLESTIINDSKSLETAKSNKELFDKCVGEEIEYFDDLRSRDMHVLMHSYACNQLAHSERCLRLWQRAKQTLE